MFRVSSCRKAADVHTTWTRGFSVTRGKLMSIKIDKSCDDLFDECESPAEEKFARFLAELFGLRLDTCSEMACYGPTDLTASEAARSLGYGSDWSDWCDIGRSLQTLRIFPQAQPMKMPYRADFIIEFGGPSGTPFNKAIWVEIDGHDFHEKTKEQAARDKKKDRAVIAAGYHLMRFTASEAHRDPTGCVKEIVNVIIASAWKLPSRSVEYRKKEDVGA